MRIAGWTLGILYLFFVENLSASDPCAQNLKHIGDAINKDWAVRMRQQMAAESPEMHRLRTAVQMVGFESAAINTEISPRNLSDYTFVLPLVEPRNQGRSGRCWMFAVEGMLRTMLQLKSQVPEDFKLSLAYLYFYSVLELSNLQLTKIIRKLEGGKVTAREFRTIARMDIEDGGWMNDALFLIGKWGLVPEAAYPEKASTMDTRQVVKHVEVVLADGLRRMAAAMNLAPFGKYQSSRKQDLSQTLRDIKDSTMRDVWRVLVSHLGNPPNEFEFRFYGKETRTKGGASKLAAELQRFTPQQFARDLIGFDAGDWVGVTSNRSHATEKVYAIADSEIGVESNGDVSSQLRLLNVSQDRMNQIVVAALRAHSPVWLAADVEYKLDPAGMLDTDRFAPIKEVYGLESDPDLTKEAAVTLGSLYPNHAMVIVGYDQPEPLHAWTHLLVMNSWGEDYGDNGFMHMSRGWFERAAFILHVPRRALNKKERTIWDSKGFALVPSEEFFLDESSR